MYHIFNLILPIIIALGSWCELTKRQYFEVIHYYMRRLHYIFMLVYEPFLNSCFGVSMNRMSSLRSLSGFNSSQHVTLLKVTGYNVYRGFLVVCSWLLLVLWSSFFFHSNKSEFNKCSFVNYELLITRDEIQIEDTPKQ